MMYRFIACASVLLVLTACLGVKHRTLLERVYEWSDQNASENESQLPVVLHSDKNGILEIPSIRLRIKTVTPLQTQESDVGMFDVTGTGARTFFVHHIEYGHRPEGLSDWQLPKEIVKKLNSDEACTALPVGGSGVYLPVQTDRLMQCAVFTNGRGQKIIGIIGYSFAFEGPDYPGSLIIIPRKNDAIVLSDLVSFPAFEQWIRKQSDMFYGRYPEDNLWPPQTPAARKFYDDASGYVGRMISQPSEEVATNLNELENWSGRLETY